MSLTPSFPRSMVCVVLKNPFYENHRIYCVLYAPSWTYISFSRSVSRTVSFQGKLFACFPNTAFYYTLFRCRI